MLMTRRPTKLVHKPGYNVTALNWRILFLLLQKAAKGVSFIYMFTVSVHHGRLIKSESLNSPFDI